MAHVRTRLMGNVVFHDRKIKWNRITLQLTGKAGLKIQAPMSALPRDAITGPADMTGTTILQTTVTICEVEKELIFTGAPIIDFGLHMPTHLPPSIKANHAFVEYTLVANFSAGSFFKKYRIQRTVNVRRHYLPNLSALIPSVEYHGVREWFEWSAEVPKAASAEVGELVVALRWSVEKERVEVDRVELALEELETYRFSIKSGVHNLPPKVIRFPSTTYHPPSFSTSSETHFIRTPLHLTQHQQLSTCKSTQPVRMHTFNPFLEISHKCRLTIHFTPGSNAKPFSLEFPVIITDCPPTGTNVSQEEEEEEQQQQHQPRARPGIGGDDAVTVDLDLPEYTPRYEQQLSVE
ncbi:hypothetical protein BDB00DRAFT_759484 [Zychaea mexicana]|uniref:uncharacterized protein n=1 Tax=Zychaea mexicana TaxID=64656 RepID=UPI0022FF3DC7|nr:uncharacterized protein BDB00DRAFT_759484 [Zychaea mexicana]KAI9495891.1 hypothetical protein BDB00DRAFT_759484 [Zychaea mexicana]